MSKTETSSPTSTRQVATLKRTVKDQNDRISSLIMTVSTLTDEVAILRQDLSRLRDNVGEDLKDLYAKANSKINR